MNELIRKTDVLNLLSDLGGTGAMRGTWADGWDQAIDAVFDAVMEMDPADEARRESTSGQWIEDESGYTRCSECRYMPDKYERIGAFCPSCGACMACDPEEETR